MRERFLGLELAGAKNNKTALSILEYYPREQKIFLLDIRDRISGDRGSAREHRPGISSGDQALLDLLFEPDEEMTSSR